MLLLIATGIASCKSSHFQMFGNASQSAETNSRVKASGMTHMTCLFDDVNATTVFAA